MEAEVKAEVRLRWSEINAGLAVRLEDADEDRSYLNNAGFMEWYYQKYGFDKRFEFLVHDDLLFVVVIDNGKKVVATCVHAKTHLAGKNFLCRPKFNHVKTKEEKQILDILNSVP